MNRIERYLLNEAKKLGKGKLWLGIVASAFLGIVMLLVDGAKSNKAWPEEQELDIATGSVTQIQEQRKDVLFNLSNSPYTFQYMPLYGRKRQAIEDALRQPNGVITVRFQLDTSINELGIQRKYQTVLALSNGQQEVLSYADSQATFASDRNLLPWLVGLALFGLVVFAYQLRLLNRNGTR
ncbi:hypothetical protein ACFO5Q_01190 [Kordiimonas lipolytica]|uniref:Uncharacterized protein n=1 Tax=Kordiimonas lipolytica TaxID=1662421 RepID=A0ABV8U6M6_9PROT|nr:hypothetical protein [Kordiimonas lipolytica]